MNRWGSHMNKYILIIIHVPFRKWFSNFAILFRLEKVSPCVWNMVGGLVRPSAVRVRSRPRPREVCEADIEVSTKLMYCDRLELGNKKTDPNALFSGTPRPSMFFFNGCLKIGWWFQIITWKNGWKSPNHHLTWWQLKHVFFFFSIFFTHRKSWGGEMEIFQFDGSIFFQMGWFNHQPRHCSSGNLVAPM